MNQPAEVAKIERNAIAEFEITPEKVAEMAKEYMKITVPEGDNAAYRMAREALTICVRTRTGTDKRRKELGEDARKWISEVNSAQKELIAPLAPVEKHLATELKREDDRKSSIKAERERIERERIERFQQKVFDINSLVANLNGLDSVALTALIAEIEAIQIDPEEYQEFAAGANNAKMAAFSVASESLEARKKIEAEEVERKAEAARLEKQRQEQEAEAARLRKIQEEQDAIKRAEREKLEAERRVIEEERARFEAEKREEQERREREAFERCAMEEARIKAESDAKEKAEREKREAEERASEEAKEAEERAAAEAAENARIEALKPDKEKLTAYAVTLCQVQTPELSTDAGRETLSEISERLNEIHELVSAL